MPEQWHTCRTAVYGQSMPGKEHTWGTTACGQYRSEQRNKGTEWQETINCRVTERNNYSQNGQMRSHTHIQKKSKHVYADHLSFLRHSMPHWKNFGAESVTTNIQKIKAMEEGEQKLYIYLINCLLFLFSMSESRIRSACPLARN